VAFLMKQHGLFFGLCGALYLLWTRIGQWLTGELEEVPLTQRDHRPRSVDHGPQAGRDTGPSALPERAVLIPSRPGRLRPELRSPARLRAEIRRFLRDAGLFALGGVLPYAVTCLVLWSVGAFPAFVFWTITYAAKYASAIPIVRGPDVLKAAVDAVIGPNIVLWILPWVGAIIMWWEERLDAKRQASPDRKLNLAGDAIVPEDDASHSSLVIRHSSLSYPRFFVTTFLLCSLASASVGLYFRAHYFILLVPALSLLTGIAVSRGLHLLRHDTTIELFLALAILGLYAIALGATLIGNGSVWLGMSPPDAIRSVYGSTLFSETARAADYIKDHSPPDARVAVLGSEPDIYFASRRRAATGYLYMYPLMEIHPYALKMQEEMIAEIEHARPEFLVYVDDDYSWLQRPDSQHKIFDWWQDYWGKDMDLVQTLAVEENLERGADVNNPMHRSRRRAEQQHILILQRRH
jgi:general stress protein CsbA